MPQLFAIVTVGRSGSTYLEQMLDSHPLASCRGEILRPDRIADSSEATIRSILNEQVHGRPEHASGFKLPLISFSPPAGIFELMQARQYKVIHVYRANRLAQYVSLRLAMENATWRSTDGSYARDALMLDPASIVTEVVSLESADTQIGGMIADFPRVTVSYEQIAYGRDLSMITAFLGLPPARMSAQISKQRQRPLRESIANYDEIAEALRAADRGRYLDANAR